MEGFIRGTLCRCHLSCPPIAGGDVPGLKNWIPVLTPENRASGAQKEDTARKKDSRRRRKGSPRFRSGQNPDPNFWLEEEASPKASREKKRMGNGPPHHSPGRLPPPFPKKVFSLRTGCWLTFAGAEMFLGRSSGWRLNLFCWPRSVITEPRSRQRGSKLNTVTGVATATR